MSMKRIGFITSALLGLYSIALLFTELHAGQDFVRGYFSDIVTGTDYPLPYRAFFGINTSISVVMLTGIALLFLVCIGLGQHDVLMDTRIWFQWSQVFIFLYLACDERLMIHEKMGSLLHIEDSLIILVLGLTELFLLFFVGRVLRQPWRIRKWLIPAAACFAGMVVVDGLFVPDMCGRLALEDLLKIWANVFLLIYAWRYCMDSVTCSLQKASDEY